MSSAVSPADDKALLLSKLAGDANVERFTPADVDRVTEAATERLSSLLSAQAAARRRSALTRLFVAFISLAAIATVFVLWQTGPRSAMSKGHHIAPQKLPHVVHPHHPHHVGKPAKSGNHGHGKHSKPHESNEWDTREYAKFLPPPPPIRAPWSIERITKWYNAQPWLVGSNYVPHTASNQFEMFQADTFNLTLIDFELGIAEDMGMNTLRVFLHDLLYKDDPKGFFKRLDQFLDVCKKHSIRPMLVIFDSCWDPNPHSGKQQEPVPHIHNSRWAQSPGQTALADVDQLPRLKQYVQALFKRFGKDDRILAWDMYNEPDNGIPPERQPFLHHLMMEAFEWAREIEGVIQPLTSGVWKSEDFTTPDKMNRAARIQIERSDFVTFHIYSDAGSFEYCVNQLKLYKRPIVNTEWLARGQGSTVEAILPLAKRLNVGAINWGFVDGRTQTKFPWDSWWREYPDEPEPWHHELIRRNGTPYSQHEYKIFQKLTGKI